MNAVPEPARLVELHRTLAALDPAGTPDAAQVCGAPFGGVRRLVALPGSFNPPHRAHFALLQAGAASAGADAVAFVLSARTVDKERVSGMLLEDRLWLLCELLRQPGSWTDGAPATGARTGAVVTSHGLYVEQAAALRRLGPRLDDLVFVVGYDKIVQIFDPRYYDDRDAALDRLFALARFLVAPRDSASAADLRALLAQPQNARFAARVAPLALDRALAHVSSTRVRQSTVPPAEDVPAPVAAFISQSGCYGTPAAQQRYAERAAAIRRAARAQPA